VLHDVGSDHGWLFQPILQQLGVSTMGTLDSITFGTSGTPEVIRSLPVRPGAMAGTPPGMAPLAGLIGADVLAKYDLVFDGPNKELRIYKAAAHSTAEAANQTNVSAASESQRAAADASSTAVTAAQMGWMPQGVTVADCVPAGYDANYPDRVFFPMTVNGQAVHSMFDSGSNTTNMNLVAAHVLGITKRTPGIHLMLPMLAPQFAAYNGQKVWQIPSGYTLTMGSRSFAPVAVHIYQHLPREKGPTDAELSVGLEAIRDRILFVSYSTRHVCLTQPATAPTAVAAAHADAASAGIRASADSQVHLTSDALAKMTTFWTTFLQEPPAIRDDGRKQHQKAIVIPLMIDTSEFRGMQLGMVDMEGMAAQYAPVAADFKKVGLTPEQWTQFRTALYSAALTQQALESQGVSASAVPTTVGTNVAFLQAHASELAALKASGMWFPGMPSFKDFGGDLDP
jgi:hypothetical protein